MILLDVNSSMRKQLSKESRPNAEVPEQRIRTAKDSIRMLLEQKVRDNQYKYFVEFLIIIFL